MTLSTHIQAAKENLEHICRENEISAPQKALLKSLITSRLTLLAEDMKSVVPPENNADHITGEGTGPSWGRGLVRGFNTCRTQTLTNIKQFLQ